MQRRAQRLGCGAHPRAGGENAGVRDDVCDGGGSSPRGRGKPGLPIPCRLDARLIPARAGKTAPRQRSARVGQAHPRAGGENAPLSAGSATPGGSSPRGRGKLRASDREDNIKGLIPARAGKTCSASHHGGGLRAHPRAGGENSNLSAVWFGLCGSSPRGRGKPASRSTAGLSSRLIPARAGKTSTAITVRMMGPAHPRAGGENTPASGAVEYTWGSSPRGRGKHAYSTPTIFPQRLIPARAGKTWGRTA